MKFEPALPTNVPDPEVTDMATMTVPAVVTVNLPVANQGSSFVLVPIEPIATPEVVLGMVVPEEFVEIPRMPSDDLQRYSEVTAVP